MDYKYKVTSKNLKSFNPLNYTEEEMNYVVDEEREKNKHDLEEDNKTLEASLLGMDIKEVDQQEMNLPEKTFEQRVEDTRTFARQQAAIIAKSDKFFGNSKEMKTIIKMVNGLNSLLEGNIPRVNGNIDVPALKDRHLKGYDAAISACQYYLDVKTPGREKYVKRYRNVEKMKMALEKERELLEVVISNIGDNKYETHQLAGIEHPRDLLGLSVTNFIEGPEELQIEGNSTDVYKIKLVRDGKVYYFKQNLKPIGDDVPGFIKRRLRQLTNSRANHNNVIKAESRLYNKIDLKDYDFATEFLNKIQSSLDSVSNKVKDSRALKKKYITFFGHDYDLVFKELDAYNAKARANNTNMMELRARIAAFEEEIKNPNLDAQEKKIYKQIIAADKKELKPLKNMPIMNEYEWLVKMSKSKKNPLGITPDSDKALFGILKKMSEEADPKAKTEGGNERIRRFFTRSMGKEFEAYGQQKERSNATDMEVMAKNNTATYRIANIYNFNDVVTSSESAVVNIKLAGTQNKENVTGTVSTEAPGVEMLKLVQLSEQFGVKIHYSPKAIRQLTRLQMFDTTCLQTDRHWRNFKCMTEPDLRNYSNEVINKDIVIKSIGSYDHDMSFGNMDLNTAFVNNDDTNGESVKNGMLPPIIRKVKTEGVDYTYYRTNYLGESDKNILDAMQRPLGALNSPYRKHLQDQTDSGRWGKKTITLKKLGVSKLENVPYRMVNGTKLYNYNGINFTVDENRAYEAIIRDSNGRNVYYHEMERFLVGHATEGLKSVNKDMKPFETMLNTSRYSNTGERVDSGAFSPGNSLAYNYQKLSKVLLGQRFDGKKDLKLFTEMNQEDRIEAVYLATKILQQLQTFDVHDNTFEGENAGKKELEVKAACYYIKEQLNSLKQADKDAILKEAKKKFKLPGQKENTEPEYTEVPTMLHMDLDAYNEIKRMQRDFDTTIKNTLMDLAWDEDKIKAYKDRIDQQILQIEKCKTLAEKVLAKKYPQGSKLRSFFLKEEDYNEITDINEMAWDPGMSYFSTEDENYLMSEEKYSMYLSETEQKGRLEKTNKHRKIERLHDLKQDLTTYSTMVSGKVKK